MKSLVRLALLVLCSAVLPAAVGGGGGFTPVRPDPGQERVGRTPGWVADPSQGGKQKAVVASWAPRALKEEQKKARADAIERLLADNKLPSTTKVKEMDMYVDPDGKTYVLLVAR